MIDLIGAKPSDNTKETIMKTTQDARIGMDGVIRLMATAMVATILVTVLAGFHVIPGWTPILPSTATTMSIGAMILRCSPKGSTFARSYGWMMIVGAPIAALLALVPWS